MRFYSTVSKWKHDILQKKILEKDVISASQFNLMANTLNHPKYAYNKLPTKGTILPPAWHLAYFPPRVPESELSSDGYETDWSPPFPYVHRMWAGGELSWNKDNPLKVGQNVTMQSSIRDVQMRQGGRRGDSVFIWVDKELHNQQGWAATESRCWVYVKQQDNDAIDQQQQQQSQPAANPSPTPPPTASPDFIINLKPTPITLFRFSAVTFNSHLIHYDHIYSTTVEHQKGCLTHGPLSFTLMVTHLDQYLSTDSNKKVITSFNYRCLSPLIVNDPITVLGKQTSANEYGLWVIDHEGKIAVKGTATVA
ncbi:hypothetical protein G6F42_016510 [Rhizopus arrhizus]|nr:hypothetical protein G6F42_016510 [Rhizopus arrhizus]